MTKIKSKFAARCRACGGQIAVGEQVNWERGAGVRHIQCPVGENGQPTHHEVTVSHGVFKKDGKIYVVKPNRSKTRVYAKEIVESPQRVNELDEHVDFESIYRPGLVFDLKESDRWPLQDARHFLTKYARCIVCGAHLKAAKSVEAAIGPVCAKYFATTHANGNGNGGNGAAAPVDVALETHTLRPDSSPMPPPRVVFNPKTNAIDGEATDAMNARIKEVHELKHHDCRAAGEHSWWENDAQGIPLCRVCRKCRAAKLSRYRPCILTGYTQADVDEPIEEDE